MTPNIGTDTCLVENFSRAIHLSVIFSIFFFRKWNRPRRRWKTLETFPFAKNILGVNFDWNRCRGWNFAYLQAHSKIIKKSPKGRQPRVNFFNEIVSKLPNYPKQSCISSTFPRASGRRVFRSSFSCAKRKVNYEKKFVTSLEWVESEKRHDYHQLRRLFTTRLTSWFVSDGQLTWCVFFVFMIIIIIIIVITVRTR